MDRLLNRALIQGLTRGVASRLRIGSRTERLSPQVEALIAGQMARTVLREGWKHDRDANLFAADDRPWASHGLAYGGTAKHFGTHHKATEELNPEDHESVLANNGFVPTKHVFYSREGKEEARPSKLGFTNVVWRHGSFPKTQIVTNTENESANAKCPACQKVGAHIPALFNTQNPQRNKNYDSCSNCNQSLRRGHSTGEYRMGSTTGKLLSWQHHEHEMALDDPHHSMQPGGPQFRSVFGKTSQELHSHMSTLESSVRPGRS